jgi:hypothetical protein
MNKIIMMTMIVLAVAATSIKAADPAEANFAAETSYIADVERQREQIFAQIHQLGPCLTSDPFGVCKLDREYVRAQVENIRVQLQGFMTVLTLQRDYDKRNSDEIKAFIDDQLAWARQTRQELK